MDSKDCYTSSSGTSISFIEAYSIASPSRHTRNPRNDHISSPMTMTIGPNANMHAQMKLTIDFIEVWFLIFVLLFIIVVVFCYSKYNYKKWICKRIMKIFWEIFVTQNFRIFLEKFLEKILRKFSGKILGKRMKSFDQNLWCCVTQNLEGLL